MEYLNATMKNARFSAVELVRFAGTGEDGQGFDAFEARFVAGAGPALSSPGSAGAKANLAGVDEFVQAITDDAYRHTIEDFLEAIAKIDYLTIYWGTTGCSLKVPISGRNPLSVGWIYPPGQARWMGLTDVTLGWYDDPAKPLALPPYAVNALDRYRTSVQNITGGASPKSPIIQGRTFTPPIVMERANLLVDAVREVATALAEPSSAEAVAP